MADGGMSAVDRLARVRPGSGAQARHCGRRVRGLHNALCNAYVVCGAAIACAASTVLACSRRLRRVEFDVNPIGYITWLPIALAFIKSS